MVLLLPFLWLLGVVAEYGVEEHPFGDGTGAALERAAAGALIGCAAGMVAGVAAHPDRRRLALAGMVVALTSTSGHGIEPGWVVGTVSSWLLAFAAFFSTAGLVQRGIRARNPPILSGCLWALRTPRPCCRSRGSACR